MSSVFKKFFRETKQESTDYAGIDYSLGKSNFDPKTKARYGLLSMNSAASWLLGEMQPDYGSSIDVFCEECSNSWIVEDISCDVTCSQCGHEMPDYFEEFDPVAWYYQDKEVFCGHSQESTELWVYRSEYFTYAQFCSPCMPGACNLDSPLDHRAPNNRCYCLPHEFFEEGIAPYPVFSVKTGKIVDPKKR